MHNIAEGFDSETNGEFIRFLRYSKRPYSKVQCERYIALDEKYISPDESRHGTAVRGFIKYLKKYEGAQGDQP